jgi:predicted amidophosphoribosyltransferase
MKTSVKEVKGSWDLGFSLDKHMISSTYLGEDEYGHPRFNNLRSEVGEATYQLKNQRNASEARPIAQAIFDNVYGKFQNVSVIIPMAASTARTAQPVDQVAQILAALTDLPWYQGWLVKAAGGKKLKDVPEEERADEVKGTMSLAGQLQGTGKVNVLLLDDLYQSGASVNEACTVLRTYERIGKIYFVAFTRKH